MNFPDLDSTHWAYTTVQFMVQKGVVKGYDDGTFKPNNSVRRGEFAKMLVLALDLPTVQPAALHLRRRRLVEVDLAEPASPGRHRGEA